MNPGIAGSSLRDNVVWNDPQHRHHGAFQIRISSAPLARFSLRKGAMNLHSLLELALLNGASIITLAVGMGWIFAEVRRHFFDLDDSRREAWEDQWHGKLTSFGAGVMVALIGAIGIWNGFGFGSVSMASLSTHTAIPNPPRLAVPNSPLSLRTVTRDTPQIQELTSYAFLHTASPDTRRFLMIFGTGLVGWLVLSHLSTGFLPPPLFGPQATAVLCALARGLLYLLLLAVFILARDHIAAGWQRVRWLEVIPFILAAVVFVQIRAGSLGPNYSEWSLFFGGWELPPITLEDRPFPYLASMLTLIGTTFAVFFIMDPRSGILA